MANFKVGVVSDAHFPNAETFEKNLYNALSDFKKNNVSLIIFAGDMCDQDYDWCYKMYQDIFNEIYDNNNKPQILSITGNHDYWQTHHVYDVNAVNQFKKYFCQEDINQHLVVEGFHFIGISSDPKYIYGKFAYKENNYCDCMGDYEYLKNWLEEQVEIAIKDNDCRPIFVVSHFPPKNTVPGSYQQFSGNKMLYDIFKKYPQVISLSGHTHLSLADERSIHQRDFTSINTGSLQCICCSIIEVPGEDGVMKEFIDLQRMPGDAYRRYTSYMILDIDDNMVKIERKFSNQISCGKDWIIKYPIKKEDFTYTDKRFINSLAPKFSSTDRVYCYCLKNKINKQCNNLNYISVKIPKYDGRILGFKYILINKKTCQEISGYSYSEIDDNIDAPKVFHIILLKDLPYGEYIVKVYAVETFGKLSTNYVETNLVVEKD